MFKKFIPQIIASLFLAGFVVYAWTEPSQTPPSGNVPAPINVGLTDQSKLGGFGLGGGVGQALQWLKNIGGSLHIKNQGGTTNLFIGQDGKVGIGTENPQGILDVGGGKLVVTAEGVVNFTAGPNNPNAVVNEGGSGINWSNPGNILTSNNTYALVTGDSILFTNYLKATGFNFSLPSNVIIDGIQADIERYGVAGIGVGLPRDAEVRIIKAGVITGSDRAIISDWPTTDTYQSYGGINDKWGAVWIPGDINDSGFGIAIKAELPGGVEIGQVTMANIDHVRITVYYRTGGMDVAKIQNVTIAGDGSVSANLNADKLDGLHASEITKTGLHGKITLYYSSVGCGLSLSGCYPLSCDALSPGQCAVAGTQVVGASGNIYNCNWYGPSCPAGYSPTKINFGSEAYRGGSFCPLEPDVYSCYKNP